jgi:hypothetical protein
MKSCQTRTGLNQMSAGQQEECEILRPSSAKGQPANLHGQTMRLTITAIIESIVFIDTSAPNPNHVLVSFDSQLQPISVSFGSDAGFNPFRIHISRTKIAAPTYVVRKESAGIQFEPLWQVKRNCGTRKVWTDNKHTTAKNLNVVDLKQERQTFLIY